MRFFRYEGMTEELSSEEQQDRRAMRDRVRKYAMKSNALLEKTDRNAFLFVADAVNGYITVGVIMRDTQKPDRLIDAYLKTIDLTVHSGSAEEITLNTLRSMLQSACRNGYVENDDSVLEQFELDRLCARFGKGLSFEEEMIPHAAKKTVYASAARLLSDETLMPELDRIYSGRAKRNVVGHPVHYMIQTDLCEVRTGMTQVLLRALHANGRLRSKRCCTVGLKPGSDVYPPLYDALYRSCIGGVLVVQYQPSNIADGEYASEDRELIELLCKAMKQYRNDVLTVFCLPRECTSAKSIFFENLGTTSIVELKEELVFKDRADRYLRRMAAENNVEADDALLSGIEPEKGYLTPELKDLFNEWFNAKLKAGVYPQYREICSVKQEVLTEAPKGSAYDELMQMIGLSEAKKVIRQALDYHKAQKLFAEKGMTEDHPAMHMVFTGNPGTAKTSVARLFARIMRENDLLSKGNLIELGRGDLVGKYVGWTAPTVQKKFREAKGGVLFIDEAYSLVDDRSGSFGDEAINTIVQEMENHREETVVIFAGYPDKMQRFLNRNPGLSSRIAFHVPFEDYSTEELCAIADLMAGQKGFVFSEAAKEKLKIGLAWARTVPDFGNGRYVRNVLERAKMAQASRLVAMDYDAVGPADLAAITDADLSFPEADRTAQPKKSAIGF